MAPPEVRAGRSPIRLRPGPLDGLANAALRRLAGHLGRGRVVIAGPGPRAGPAGASPVVSGPTVTVELHDPRAARAILLRGSEGMAESYVAGWWDTDDLTGLIRLLIDNLERPIGRLDAMTRRAVRPFARARRAGRPTPAADRRNVAAHYDLPGELFEVMLDETMSYSCAVFEPPAVDLAQAQRAKLDRLCDKLDLGPDDHLVEIGTGWGGLAVHAATRTGCRVTTTTISEAQREVALRRVHDAGLADRVTVLGLDYRELEGTYDRLVSVEMIEAVDWRLYPTFFATCRRLLRPDGLMALQAITIADRSFERATLHEDFARAMVFPGGCLPSVTAVMDSVTDSSDLVLVDLEDIGRHYPTTLRAWSANVDAGWDRLAAAGFDEGFRRLWHFYLAYCEAAFLERRISDVQMVLAGPRWRPDAAGVRGHRDPRPGRPTSRI